MVVELKSPVDVGYNCIAWAGSDPSRWWWPIAGYWPRGIKRELTLKAFEEAYRSIGFEVCHSEYYEEGFEKIAVYADEDKRPQHAARQLRSGRWTSKLGQGPDVEHDLHEIRGFVLHYDSMTDYGRVMLIMKKSINNF